MMGIELDYEEMTKKTYHAWFSSDKIKHEVILTNKQLDTHHIIGTVATDALGPLLLTWFNFNPSMDK